MLASVVPYGGNAVRYALEKEKAKLVKVNHMPEGIDPTAIWYMMKHHCQLHQQDRTVGRALERFMVQFVISPSKEEAANFTMKDWQNLHEEALETLDAVGLIPKGMKKEIKTNFRNSMNVGALTGTPSLEHSTFILTAVVLIWMAIPMTFMIFTNVL